DRIPLLSRMRGADDLPATPDEQATLRIAVEAIVGTDLESLRRANRRPVTRKVETTAGPITVSLSSDPDSEEVAFRIRAEHAVGFTTRVAGDGTPLPTLVLKLARPD